MSDHSVEVDEAGFEREVVETSKSVPVLVDFWAPWCAPCRTLKPMLEKLAAEYGGKFILAKVNSDENPGLAAKYRVRGIPDVRAFVGGEMVDGFTGVIPDSQLRAFVDSLIPSPAEKLRQEAGKLDPVRAKELLMTALELEPGNSRVKSDLAGVSFLLGEKEAAEALLTGLPESPELSRLRAKLAFSKAADKGADREALAAKIASAPEDVEARIMLANLHAAVGDFEPALRELLEAVKINSKDDRARKTMLSIFELAPTELASRYRKLLASALH